MMTRDCYRCEVEVVLPRNALEDFLANFEEATEESERLVICDDCYATTTEEDMHELDNERWR